MSDRRRPDTPFWVERAAVQADRLTLSPEESHHLLHVHRAEIGAPFEAVDGAGGLYECTLDSVVRHNAVGRIVARREGAGELAQPIRLLVGIADRGAIETIVEQTVPLCVTHLDFVACDRSGRGALGAERLARLDRRARAGVKQSRRSRLPEVTSSESLVAGLAKLPPGKECRYFADPSGDWWDLGAGKGIQMSVALAVGPPGGFSDGEQELLVKHGFRSISLGPNRLSTETAAILIVGLARNSLF